TTLFRSQMFTYALIVYLVLEAKGIVLENFAVTIILGVLAVGLADIFIYFIYLVIGIGTVSWPYYFIYRIVPTIVANIIFLLMLYPLAAHFLVKWRDRNAESF